LFLQPKQSDLVPAVVGAFLLFVQRESVRERSETKKR
jgi:hypothetical protein